MSCPLGSLRTAKKVQLHHGDLAAFVKFEIRDFKHWRSFSWPRSSARQLNTVPFQISTLEFSPSLEIASVILNSNSKQVVDEHRRTPLLRWG